MGSRGPSTDLLGMPYLTGSLLQGRSFKCLSSVWIQ